MFQDPIVKEIRSFRKQHSEKYGNNLDEIFKAIKKSEKKSGKKFINLKPVLTNKK